MTAPLADAVTVAALVGCSLVARHLLRRGPDAVLPRGVHRTAAACVLLLATAPFTDQPGTAWRVVGALLG